MTRKARMPLLQVLIGVVIKEAKITFRYVGSLLTVMALPFMVGGLFTGIGYAVGGPNAPANFARNTGVENPLLYMVLGGVLMMASLVMVESTSSTIRSEQLIGTFELHYLTPNNTAALWLLHALATSILTLTVFSIDMAAILVWYGSLLSPLDWLIAVFIMLLSVLPLAGIGLVIAAVTIRFKEVNAIANVVNAFIAVLSGFYYPLEVFPRLVQIIAEALPTSHAAELLRSLVSGQLDVPLESKLLVMSLLAFAYLALGKVVYSRWEYEARRKGELSKY